MGDGVVFLVGPSVLGFFVGPSVDGLRVGSLVGVLEGLSVLGFRVGLREGLGVASLDGSDGFLCSSPFHPPPPQASSFQPSLPQESSFHPLSLVLFCVWQRKDLV